MASDAPLLELRGVSKRYGGVRALEFADLDVQRGRIHALLGENGAGKSTLIKIIAGVVAPDEGRLLLDGTPVRFTGPADANAAGIACVFQELSLIPDLSVAENILLAQPPMHLGLIDARAQRRMAEATLARAGGHDIHPLALVKDLPLSRRQIVEIAKALARQPRLLILDEATSALTAKDVRTVVAMLHRLREEGVALLYISHRMHEIAELADQCTVFRNGRRIATFDAGSRSDAQIVEMMIGREYSGVFPTKPTSRPATQYPRLEVKDLRWAPRLNGVSLTAGAGEIVGLGGLDGQGQRELLLGLFGVLRDMSGTVLVDGKAARITSPSQAKARPICMALIPEDRKTEGLMLPMSIRDNLSFASLDQISHWGVIDRTKERRAVEEVAKLLNIRTPSVDVAVGTLSGGNQQKAVIAKWLMRRPRIVLLNDPTRGIDVGTKQELYQLLRKLADDGATILLYSTDYDELIGCCDRVLVLFDGRITRTLVGAEITERALVASALNVDAGEEAFASASS